MRRGLLAGLLCALAAVSPSRAEEVGLRLWIAWGGGGARPWQAQIRLDDGDDDQAQAFSEIEPVGGQPDEPGSAFVSQGVLHKAPRNPRSYDGVSLLVTAPRSAALSIQLTPGDQPGAARRVRIPLEQLIAETHNSVLDERGNRLLVRRTAGDKLRVRFHRDALVFAPGETFEFTVDPYLVGTEAGTSLTYHAQLLRARSTDKLWEDQREATVDAQGDPPAVGPFAVPLPKDEGVYDIQITLNKRRLPTRLAPAKLLYQRHVQVAVVAPAAATAKGTAAWKTVSEINPQIEEAVSDAGHGKSKVWDAMPKLPQWKWLPGSADEARQKPLGNGKSRKRTHLDRDLLELGPGGWQAYPLPISQVNRPHVLELDYPNDQRQTLGISILDPNAAGMIGPPGVDSGLDVPSTSALIPARLERHRVVFWPRSTTPVLLLVNHREDGPAVFGRLRVLAGPAELPARSSGASDEGRLLGLYYDRPLVAENFSASDTLDPVTGRNLNDWVTFYQGGTRWVQYLKHTGYNGAVLSVLHEGSTIYPSRLLEPVAKYDNGLFFANGQDPVRKDVLELLFRLFDREGLKLIPAVQFSTPLPELEAALRQDVPLWRSGAAADAPQDPSSADGLELVGADGKPWREGHAERSAGPYYNPLDPRVQQAMRRVVDELVERYREHPAFGGLAIQLGPQTFAQLPDADWACDQATVSRFAQAEKITVPGLVSGDFEQQLAYLSGAGYERWLKWRARELARFYQSLQADLAAKASGAKLYLAGADLLQAPELQRSLQPRLPERLELDHALLRVGFDPQQYPGDGGVVLLRPHRLAPLSNLETQAVNLQLHQAPEMETTFGFVKAAGKESPVKLALRSTTGSLFYHEPRSLPLPAFDRVSPLGPDKTHTWLFSHCVPAGYHNRQRFVQSLAALDSQVLFDGGWMGLLGQQDAVAELADVYRRLPAARFTSVLPKTADVEQPPVVVRKLSHEGRTYLYLVNASPWPVTVALDLTAKQTFSWDSLNTRQVPAPAIQGNQATWEVALLPYDLIGARCSAADLEVSDWRVTIGREVFVELRKSLDDLRRRANLLKDPPTLTALANPGFELPVQGDVPPGWEFARNEGTSVRIESQQSHSGQNSLHLRSNGPVVWVRSNPFRAAKTGRLSVWVWLKVDRVEGQPPLRLAVEGRLNGQTYYRPAEVGARQGNASAPALTTAWAPYLLRIDNLPTQVTDLRVAFDLMGKGDVWIDDVQVFDLWFDKTERNELLKQIALANFCLGKGELIQCARILDGYWGEFLRRSVPTEQDQLAGGLPPPDAPAAPETAGKEKEKPKASTSWLQRIVPKPSKVPNVFR